MSGIIGSGDGPEFQTNSNYIGSYDFEWLSIQNLDDVDLRPAAVKDWLIQSI